MQIVVEIYRLSEYYARSSSGIELRPSPKQIYIFR